MKVFFQPSAELFLNAIAQESDSADLLNHIIDEARNLAINPVIDMVDKAIFPLPHSDAQFYRILWGKQNLGRAFWYIYEPDKESDLLRVHNIGHVGLEAPFLSRR